MTAHIGFVDNTSGTLAHYKMIEKIRDVCLAEGWTILRYDTSGFNWELIMMAPGFSGSEQIFCGLYTYHDVGTDYYNLAVAVMKGYNSALPFTAQPGIITSGVPAHNQRIDYWISVNKQRINVALKVGTPVYETFSIGKFYPYARPSQYPQPYICAGMLNGVTATRYSDTSHSFAYKGNRANMRMNFNDGVWKQPLCNPWGLNSAGNVRPHEPIYTLTPVELYDSGNIYGYVDGIYHITGFNNGTENTLTIDGKNYVVIQDVARNGFSDYIALELS